MNREIAYSLVRITYGVIFVTTGTSKFLLGLTNFVGGMNQRFSGKLPAAVVMPFAFAIPFCEVIAGILILIGLFTRRFPNGELLSPLLQASDGSL